MKHIATTLAPLAVAALSCAAHAQTTTLFGQTWRVQRFDYKASIQWANPVSPFNQQGLIRVEGAWWLPNGHMLVTTSHQDQSVPTTYANFILEVVANTDGSGSVTGLSYVRTVVENDPALLGSPFDLRAGGVAINPTGFGIGAGGNVLAADGGSSDTLRAYDLTTGALLPYGPMNVGLPLNPPMADLTDVTLVAEGAAGTHRFYALDETGLKIHRFQLDGTADGNFGIAGAVNPAVAPADPKGVAWLTDVPTWPVLFHGRGGVLLVSMGDQRSGIQAFEEDGTEIAWEPIDNTVFVTSSATIQPKIEAVAADPATGRLFLWMEKGSLVDNWCWVLTPDCNANSIADVYDIQNGTELDVDGNGKPDACEAVGTAICFGDGSGTACPCGNSSAPGLGRGCLNSLGSGAQIQAVGTASIAADTLILSGRGMTNSTVLYVQGSQAQSGGVGNVFGDGLRCAGGNIVRLKTTVNVSGNSSYPQPGDTSVSVRGGCVAGDVRTYQTWYRNGATFCTDATFNLSNGLTITWGI